MDGTPWKPGSGDHICSDHFVTGKTSDVPNNPNYVPSIETNNSNTIKESNTAMVCLNVLVVIPNYRRSKGSSLKEICWHFMKPLNKKK